MRSDQTPSATPARSFGRAADLYDAVRPTYPAEALTWMTGPAPLDVVDLGAGTGLLTRGLVALGHRVTAVEPDRQMLDKLVASSPGLAGHRQGSAEELPLPDGSADVVCAGQAYHWFDRERALPEIRRVLRPDGLFAPVWNGRDESVDWVRALSEIIGASTGELAATAAARPGHYGPYFTEAESKIVRGSKTFDRAGLIGLIQSRSLYLTADDDTKGRLIAAVEYLVDTHPRLAGRDTFEMPYTTHAYRARPA
ncbi:class I SAM-dependent methyltransferase [Glycomyces xiaoerkulensis]|uniref:class I SAM-dependent methyltransferase n=1 Tax=Glycomyces xiaoerkulensis TaxID=2038139 RepID=UPI000C268E19|nr:class I SAM-dependent methyltransferase [Glycomyces xiaoerkulensis]